MNICIEFLHYLKTLNLRSELFKVKLSNEKDLGNRYVAYGFGFDS